MDRSVAMLSGRGTLMTMMAWVWLASICFSTVGESLQDTREAFGAPEAQFLTYEPPKELGSSGGFLPVPVWKFVKVSDGADNSDLGRPQFSCNETSMSVRWSLVRHSNMHLEDGRMLSSLPEGCGASLQTVESWLLLKIPYSDCPLETLVVDGTNFHQLKLQYFDHLLQSLVTAVATCPASAAHQGAPLLRCRAKDVTVKLPLGTKLQRIRALGDDSAFETVLITTTHNAELVKISAVGDVETFLEMRLLDSAGEMSTVLVACSKATSSGKDRQRRAVPTLHVGSSKEFKMAPRSHYDHEYGDCGMDLCEDVAATTACVAPTTAPWCVEPTTAPWCVEPTTAPWCVEPTTTPWCVAPTTLPVCVQPTTPPACIEPTTPPACIEPTTPPACIEPTTPPACIEPTTTPACIEPTTTPASVESTTTAACTTSTTPPSVDPTTTANQTTELLTTTAYNATTTELPMNTTAESTTAGTTEGTTNNEVTPG